MSSLNDVQKFATGLSVKTRIMGSVLNNLDVRERQIKVFEMAQAEDMKIDPSSYVPVQKKYFQQLKSHMSSDFMKDASEYRND